MAQTWHKPLASMWFQYIWANANHRTVVDFPKDYLWKWGKRELSCTKRTNQWEKKHGFPWTDRAWDDFFRRTFSSQEISDILNKHDWTEFYKRLAIFRGLIRLSRCKMILLLGGLAYLSSCVNQLHCFCFTFGVNILPSFTADYFLAANAR